MALYAFDGTWNSAKDGEDQVDMNTNVVHFHRAYHARSNTNDFYVAGVGTRLDLAGRLFGGAFGLGELPRLNEGYDRLCENWANGDRTIDIIGFSRGAATTLDFCHMIQDRGIRTPGTDDVVEPSPEIRFVGVWDVVGAFGLASLGNVALNIGHHLSLPKSRLRYCFHALALDERRPSFLPIRLEGGCEVWFRGAHSDVGGGNGNRGLNDIALKWMISKGIASGLPLTAADLVGLQPNPAAVPDPSVKLPFPLRLVGALDRRHYTISPLHGWATPPSTCPVETDHDEQTASELGAGGIEVLPLAVQRRVAAIWEAASDAARGVGYSLDACKDLLLTLFQGRVPLVTNDDDLRRARHAAVRILAVAIDGAKQHGYSNTLPPFFVTEAIWKLPRTYPFTD
jgi:hypothetical protein